MKLPFIRVFRVSSSETYGYYCRFDLPRMLHRHCRPIMALGCVYATILDEARLSAWPHVRVNETDDTGHTLCVSADALTPQMVLSDADDRPLSRVVVF